MKFKLGDRVYFQYAGGNMNQRGFGTVVAEGTRAGRWHCYYVHKDGEEKYKNIKQEAWLVEQHNGDYIEHELVYNSPLYKALL